MAPVSKSIIQACTLLAADCPSLAASQYGRSLSYALGAITGRESTLHFGYSGLD